MNFVQPDYFAALGIRVLEGRAFTPADMESGAAVVINSPIERAARPPIER